MANNHWKPYTLWISPNSSKAIQVGGYYSILWDPMPYLSYTLFTYITFNGVLETLIITQNTHLLRLNLLGQGSFWHGLFSLASPSHSLPFIWGSGELHSRILVITPVPQVTEQEDQGDQWLQAPSCLTINRHSCYQLWGLKFFEAICSFLLALAAI